MLVLSFADSSFKYMYVAFSFFFTSRIMSKAEKIELVEAPAIEKKDEVAEKARFREWSKEMDVEIAKAYNGDPPFLAPHGKKEAAQLEVYQYLMQMPPFLNLRTKQPHADAVLKRHIALLEARKKERAQENKDKREVLSELDTQLDDYHEKQKAFTDAKAIEKMKEKKAAYLKNGQGAGLAEASLKGMVDRKAVDDAAKRAAVIEESGEVKQINVNYGNNLCVRRKSKASNRANKEGGRRNIVQI
jgi:hypothetical protein